MPFKIQKKTKTDNTIFKGLTGNRFGHEWATSYQVFKTRGLAVDSVVEMIKAGEDAGSLRVIEVTDQFDAEVQVTVRPLDIPIDEQAEEDTRDGEA